MQHHKKRLDPPTSYEWRDYWTAPKTLLLNILDGTFPKNALPLIARKKNEKNQGSY